MITNASAPHIPWAFNHLDPRSFRRLDAVTLGVFDCPHSTPKLTPTGPLVVRTQDIMTGVLRTDEAARVSEETYRARVAQAEPAYGDLLYSREGTYFGIAAEVPKGVRVCLGQRMVLIRPDPRQIDHLYLKYWLNSPQIAAHMHGFRDGSVAERLNLPTIREMPVFVRPVTEQRAIGSVLGALDDKIEQNRRTGRALERLAGATFKAWFVDFDPVKAKAAGAVGFPGMPHAAFAALPSHLADSKIGLVPQGWVVRSLSKVADFLNGLALQKYPPAGDETDLPVIKIAELRNGSTEGSAVANANVPDAYVIEDGDLLFSWSGTLEAELWFGGRGALNQHLFKVTSDDYPRWLCLNWVRQHLPEFRLIASGKATTMGHIKRGHLDDAQVVVPDDAVLHAADDAIGPLHDLHAGLALETRKLAALP